MRKLYNKDSECMADEDQIDLMLAAGWSIEKPAPEKKEVSKDDSDDSDDSTDESAPKKVVKRKIKKIE